LLSAMLFVLVGALQGDSGASENQNGGKNGKSQKTAFFEREN